MPFPFDWLAGLAQNAGYQLPRNQSPIPPNFYQQSPVPQQFYPPLPTPNPMRSPPSPQPGMGAPGAGMPGGASAPPGTYAGNITMGPNLGDMMMGPGSGHPPGGLPAGTYGGNISMGPNIGDRWNPATLVPPAIAAQTDTGRGLLSPTSGAGYPNLPPSSYYAPGALNPSGGGGEAPTGQPQPVYPPGSPLNKNPPPKPQRKPNPPQAKEKVSPPSDQERYTSKRKGTQWEPGTGQGYYEALSGGFGSQPWRRPKR